VCVCGHGDGKVCLCLSGCFICHGSVCERSYLKSTVTITVDILLEMLFAFMFDEQLILCLYRAVSRIAANLLTFGSNMARVYV